MIALGTRSKLDMHCTFGVGSGCWSTDVTDNTCQLETNTVGRLQFVIVNFLHECSRFEGQRAPIGK